MWFAATHFKVKENQKTGFLYRDEQKANKYPNFFPSHNVFF